MRHMVREIYGNRYLRTYAEQKFTHFIVQYVLFALCKIDVKIILFATVMFNACYTNPCSIDASFDAFYSRI